MNDRVCEVVAVAAAEPQRWDTQWPRIIVCQAVVAVAVERQPQRAALVWRQPPAVAVVRAAAEEQEAAAEAAHT